MFLGRRNYFHFIDLSVFSIVLIHDNGTSNNTFTNWMNSCKFDEENVKRVNFDAFAPWLSHEKEHEL